MNRQTLHALRTRSAPPGSSGVAAASALGPYSGLMTWVEPFYSETGTWWGQAESAITSRDHARVETVHRLTGRTDGHLLDLGSSYGNSAAAFALAGWSVVGVEISDRIQFADHHLATVAAAANAGALEFIRGDFTTTDWTEPFDVITYWNGFGVGSDVDQRRLLNRVADWLQPEGHLVMDVFNPVQWIGWAGDESHRDAAPDLGYPFSVTERTDYDPVTARFIDTWRRDDTDTEITQSQRCYSPADLALLVEPTRLQLLTIELDGISLTTEGPIDDNQRLLTAHEYQALLRPC